MIKFNEISISFLENKVLDNVSGTFEKGKISVILGANGAGKSTLLSILSGILKSSSGDIEIDGTKIENLNPQERAKIIGYLPQGSDIYWDVNVGSLVELGRLPHNNGWNLSDKDKEIITQAMELTDTLAFSNRIANKLSGGEKSRVLLARVIAGNPEWFFADEPLAALDPLHQVEILEVFRKIADAGKGVVLVLHDLTHAARIADEIIILDKGKIFAQGAPEEILNYQNLSHTYGISTYFTKCDDGKPIIVTKGRSLT